MAAMFASQTSPVGAEPFVAQIFFCSIKATDHVSENALH